MPSLAGSADEKTEAAPAPGIEVGIAAAAIWSAHEREIVTPFGGTSMLPAIIPGQPLVVRCGQRPAIGEVAVYRRRGTALAVHRVVASRDSWLLTWGDANPLPDEPVDADRQLLGVVGGVHRNGRIEAVPPDQRSLFRTLLLWLVLFGVGNRSEHAARRILLAHRVLRLVRAGPAAGARRFIARARLRG